MYVKVGHIPLKHLYSASESCIIDKVNKVINHTPFFVYFEFIVWTRPNKLKYFKHNIPIR